MAGIEDFFLALIQVTGMIDCEQEDIVEAVGHIYSANSRRALVLTHLAWGLSAVVIGISDFLHFVAHLLTSGFLPLLIYW